MVLKSRISQFWRHQKDSPRWYLATIESIHQFLVELHTCAIGMDEDYEETIKKYLDVNDIIKNTRYTNYIHQYSGINSEELMQKYNGQYDNLLYFFKYMFEHIHSIYNRNQLKAYKRPLT